MPLSLALVSLRSSARIEFRRDGQPALELRIGEDRAGDVADAGDRPRLQAQRHAHRPGRQPAPPFRAHIDEAGTVERHARRGQAIGIIRGREWPVERRTPAAHSTAHVGEQRRRLQQVDAMPEPAKAVAREIDGAAGDRPGAPASRHRARPSRPGPRTSQRRASSRPVRSGAASLPVEELAPASICRRGDTGPCRGPSASRAVGRPERSRSAFPRQRVQLPLPPMARLMARCVPTIAGSTPSRG